MENWREEKWSINVISTSRWRLQSSTHIHTMHTQLYNIINSISPYWSQKGYKVALFFILHWISNKSRRKCRHWRRQKKSYRYRDCCSLSILYRCSIDTWFSSAAQLKFFSFFSTEWSGDSDYNHGNVVNHNNFITATEVYIEELVWRRQ